LYLIRGSNLVADSRFRSLRRNNIERQ